MERANISSKGNCDLISRLPDPILHHILGLLKTKGAVQTCVLSKRWEHLWTSLPFLNFNFDDFFPLCKGLKFEEYFVKWTAASGRLVKFVNTLLLRREPLYLDVFRLSCELCSVYKGHEEDWVYYAMKHNTRILHLSFYGSLLSCIFSCTSIEELDITTCGVKISRTVNLPSLRKLSIRKTDLVKNELQNLLFGCRVLDYLLLEDLYFNESEISHEKLQHLTFINCCNMELQKTPLFISAPNLLTLCYDLWPPKTTLNMPSLSFARKVVCTDPSIPWWEELAAFLSGLVNVEVLEIEVVLTKLQGLGASTSESTGGLLSAVISQCKILEFVEVKHRASNQMVRQLIDALIDGTKELKNLKILSSTMP